MILSDVLTSILFLIPLAAFCVAAIYVSAKRKGTAKTAPARGRGKTVRRKAPPAPESPPDLVPVREDEPAPHTHPAADSGSGRIVAERVPSPAGSLGELRDEGCAEHGDVRYVLTASPDVPEDVSELERHVVWSEILGKPVSLRGRRR